MARSIWITLFYTHGLSSSIIDEIKNSNVRVESCNSMLNKHPYIHLYCVIADWEDRLTTKIASSCQVNNERL